MSRQSLKEYETAIQDTRVFEQSDLDQRWLDEHPERQFLLRKARSWEVITNGNVTSNAVIVRRLDRAQGTRIKTLSVLTGKPIGQSFAAWAKMLNRGDDSAQSQIESCLGIVVET